MGFERVKKGDFEVGQELPCPVYTETGILLLGKGIVIENSHQLKMLVEKGWQPDERPQTLLQSLDKKIDNPFVSAYDIQQHLNPILKQLSYPTPDGPGRLSYTAELIYLLCRQHPDAMIGFVHTYREKPYSITHSLHVGILSALLAMELGFDEHQIEMTIAAALTGNIAMLDMQDRLEKQDKPLSDEQKEEIKTHPQQTVELLQKNVIYDDIWLTAVMQHHENVDGSGYPLGLKGDEISVEAKVISVCDRYSSMVVAHMHHEARLARDVLKDFYLAKGKSIDEEIGLRFIKMLGIFPPGNFVKLKNGETAIVTYRCRNKDELWPRVSSYKGMDNNNYLHPLKRDTNHEDYRIVDMVSIDTPPFSNSVLWGYEAH